VCWAWEGGDPYYNNDEPRHLTTGAFWCDFLRELPFDDPVGFAKRYFVQYPNLGLLASPPLFPMVEGLAFRIGGVSAASARAVMAAFMVVFLVGWWLWIREYMDETAAVWATLLAALVSDVFRLSGHVMLEVPLLAWMTVAVVTFRSYLRTERSGRLWAACGAVTAAMLTRFHAPIVLGPLLVQLVVSRQWHLLRRGGFWLPVLVGAGICGAYCGINMRYYHTWHTLLERSGFAPPGELARGIAASVGWAPAAIGLVGLVGVPVLPLLRRYRRRNGRRGRRPLPGAVAVPLVSRSYPWPLAAWIGATVVMWFWITYRPVRFLVYAWPAMVALGTYTLFALADRMRIHGLAHGLAALAVAVAAWQIHVARRPGLEGYGQVAAEAMAASQTRRIFFHGRQDGSFIWNVRQGDPNLAYAVFRASKTLSTGEPVVMKDFRPLVESREQILALLDGLGVDVVVSEDQPEIDEPPYRTFMNLLSSERFEPIGQVDLRNSDGRIQARRLTLYRYHRTAPASTRVAIPLTALGPGAELSVDLSRPLRGWRSGGVTAAVSEGVVD
jgi:hypothetical protein